jgi:hypothetical protein
MHALVLIGSLGVVPLLAWLAEAIWPEKKILGRDPGTAFACYSFSVLVGWADLAILS